MSYWHEAAKLGDKYETFYLGKYSEEDKSVIAAAIAEREAINNRDPVNIDDLVHGRLSPDTPGLIRLGHGPDADPTKGKEFTAEFNALVGRCNDPDNPLWSDSEYARSLGYKDTLAMPLETTVGSFWGNALPEPLRDALCINGLNRIHYFYKPVYPGDTLYGICNKCDLTELTPEEGNEYRTFRMYGEGEAYNQNGELVGKSIGFVKENLKRYAEKHEEYDGHDFADFWDSADWWARKPHHFTEEDWRFLEEQWANEKRRGAEPLYWEDVKVGEYIPSKYVGPITVEDLDNRYLVFNDKEEHLTIREKLADPERRAKLYLDPADGIYYDGPEHDMLSNVQPGFDFVDRQILENSICAYFAVSNLYNWMGDRGWIYKIAWDIMSVFPGYDGLLPDHPDEPLYIQKVPGYENYRVRTHGMVSDVCVCKAYIQKKYVLNGDYMVDLTWWCETFDGDVFEEGEFTVKLPSRDNA